MMDDNKQSYSNVVGNIQEASKQYEELNHKPERLQMERVTSSKKYCRRPRCWDWALITGLVIVATLVAVLVTFMTYQANLRGPNPEAPSTKEDSCLLHDGLKWEEFKESCYYFETEKEMTWDEAGHDCSVKGASLVSIHSRQEHDFVYRKLIEKNSNIKSAWTGLFRSDKKWKWSDFSTLDFEKWAPGEPSNNGDNEDCMEFCVDRHSIIRMWNDSKCTITLNYVCKAPKHK